MQRKAFSLIELLVVVSVTGLLMAILLPVLSRARRQAKIVTINAELRQIGLCLEMYMESNAGKHPPTRQDCTMGWEDHQLPPELVEGGYLPRPVKDSGMSAGIEDRYNRGNTYKYWAVGELYQNQILMSDKRARLYVPEGFPDCEGPASEDLWYDDPKTSPVTWVVFSQGPNYDAWDLIKVKHGPVPRRCWYQPAKRQGLIVRMRLKNGRHRGSFDSKAVTSEASL
jgi:prepilin-type N-terminal cleavage/methylation domain-containing protein